MTWASSAKKRDLCVDHADVDCDHCGHDHDAGIHEETRPEMDTGDM